MASEAPTRPAVNRLLRPRSVVIVGASDKLGASALSNMVRNGFVGDIHLINPKRAQIGGRLCPPSVYTLPEDVDVAVFAMPLVAVLDTVRALTARKVGAAIIFSEGGEEGLAEQREIGRIAAASGMVIEDNAPALRAAQPDFVDVSNPLDITAQ